MLLYVPGRTAELVELSPIGEDDESDLSVAENGEFVGLLEKTVSPLGEGHLPVDFVLYPLQLNPTSPHTSTLSLSLSVYHENTHWTKSSAPPHYAFWLFVICTYLYR